MFSFFSWDSVWCRGGVRYYEKKALTNISCNTAQVWLTWESVPREGASVEAWSWTNIYGFRLPPGAGEDVKGWWEYAVSDEEIGKLLERFPKFFES